MKPALLWEVGWGPGSPWCWSRASVAGTAFRSSVPRLAPPAKRQRRCAQCDDPRCSGPSGLGSESATLCAALDWARIFSVCGSWNGCAREHARVPLTRLPGLVGSPHYVGLQGVIRPVLKHGPRSPYTCASMRVPHLYAE